MRLEEMESLCASLILDGELSGWLDQVSLGPLRPGFQTVVLPGSPGYALYPSAQVPMNDGLETGIMGATAARRIAWHEVTQRCPSHPQAKSTRPA